MTPCQQGIDPGWDYNPGEGRLAHLQKVLVQKTLHSTSMPAFIRSSTIQQAEQEALRLGVKSAD